VILNTLLGVRPLFRLGDQFHQRGNLRPGPEIQEPNELILGEVVPQVPNNVESLPPAVHHLGARVFSLAGHAVFKPYGAAQARTAARQGVNGVGHWQLPAKILIPVSVLLRKKKSEIRISKFETNLNIPMIKVKNWKFEI
jgi:hypothetical protein